MNGSLQIGKAFGIPIRIHWTFLLWPYIMSVRGSQPLDIVFATVAVFGCVALHELGHSVVARSFGIQVLDISLWCLGGLARMSLIPESPRIEGLVAIAGPAVNFALAGFGLIGLLLGGVLELPGENLWLFFVALNLVQGVFNLIPAFPMDGGRLLRSFLARKRDWLAATEIAVRVGRVVAVLLFALAVAVMISQRSLCLLPLVALFVWFAGAKELLAVRMRHGAFPFGSGWRPAEAPAGAGAAPAPPAPPAQTGASAEPGARRPLTWMQRTFRRGGFSEEEVRWLEAYRGPLRRPPDAPE